MITAGAMLLKIIIIIIVIILLIVIVMMMIRIITYSFRVRTFHRVFKCASQYNLQLKYY